MKNCSLNRKSDFLSLFFIIGACCAASAVKAQCPTFPAPLYSSLVYNLGCVPWDLAFQNSGTMYGNTDGATFQWYRYPYGSSKANAVPCDWQTDHTTCNGFLPATDELDSYYVYFCRVTAPNCGSTESGEFYVQVGPGGNACITMDGATFTITSSGTNYTSGQDVTITAHGPGTGGDHVYVWYHNGEVIDFNDPHYEYIWDFTNPKLIIHNVTGADGGTYSVSMQDGTECFMYTDPVRVKVDNPTCGPDPVLSVAKKAVCAGESTTTTLTNNTLAAGEIGKLEYMLKPDNSNPTTTAPGAWIADQPGLYQFKYVVDNPNNESCFRESKVVSVTVAAGGAEPTITPSAEVIEIGNALTFTVSAPAAGETGTVTGVTDKGQAVNPWPNTYPNAISHTNWTPGTVTYTYTVKNASAGCAATAQCTVLWYHCGYGKAAFTNWQNTTIKLGQAVNLKPSTPETGLVGTYTYSKDGGNPVEIDPSQPYTPDEPGVYSFRWALQHSDPRVTECASETIAVITVQPCGTMADISTNKTTLKAGESATITYNTPAAGETGKLTYSKDGGAEQPLATTPSPYTFAPAEPGTYVVSYTITPVGCDPNSKSVTVKVYDCGQDASVVAGHTTIQPGGSTTITVSGAGTDETGVLTVSKDGGAATTATPGAFTPTEEGIYTFVYTITHAFIECTRSAQTQVKVAACGDPVNLNADKQTLALGGSVTVTPSRPPKTQDGETAALTVSFNGGAATPLTYSQAPVTYTPAAAGTYVFNYTVSNSQLDCESNAQATVKVGECGPDAEIRLDKETIALGESVAATLSALGAEETATLTVSRNGANPEPLAVGQNPVTYTPAQAGTYTFTWSIQHGFIDCDRSASSTLKVYQCGAPATIAADKTDIKAGETVMLTLSAVTPDETATITVSKDGGAASPVSGTTFVPAEAGVYVITYTVTHNQIDCSSSAQVTIHAYDCGPEAKVTLADEEIKLLRSTTITLSDLGANETATLTVSKDGGAATPLTYSLSPVTYTPQDLGTYVFTYTVTHALIDCERSATDTLRVVEAELVFDDKNATHVWSDPKNWWPSYTRIPTLNDSAIVRKPCTVDIAGAQARDLNLEEMLTIKPSCALLVKNRLTQAKPHSVIVAADQSGNGALVLGEENTDVTAVVHFYSRSTDMDALHPVWQYMGYPLRDNEPASRAYNGAVFYEWTNTPNTKIGGNWQRIDSLAGTLVPFTGYAMTEKNEYTHLLQGTLNNPVQKAIALPYNDQGQYPGFAFVANSWVAPIDIAAMETADFGTADATVYIMNAGTYAEALQQQGSEARDGTGAARGQYNTIPVHAASYLPNALSVIPPMQGFFVHTAQATTLTLDYSKAVFTPALTKVNTTPTRAPQTITNHQSPISNILRFRVEGFGSEDEVWLLAGNAFTKRFDNGWDGHKVRSGISPLAMAVHSEDGPLAVAAIPEIEGTELLFEGGNHKTYTITVEISDFKSPISNDLYLLDKESGIYTEIRDGATYAFQCTAATRRFVIAKKGNLDNSQSSVTVYKYLENGILYIRAGERLYNGNGELLR